MKYLARHTVAALSAVSGYSVFQMAMVPFNSPCTDSISPKIKNFFTNS